MRLLKDDKYKSILCAARNEFISRGFKDASMRVIAKDANVGLSNIYNYFENKDEIFLAIVTPAKNEMYAFIEREHQEDNLDFDRISTFGYLEEVIDAYIEIIYRYKEEMCLLLYSSEGSSLRGFRDTFSEFLTNVSRRQMKMIKKHYPHSRDVSVFFMRSLSSWMVGIIGEIITQNMSKRKVRELFKECFIFEMAGWRKLTGV